MHEMQLNLVQYIFLIHPRLCLNK